MIKAAVVKGCHRLVLTSLVKAMDSGAGSLCDLHKTKLLTENSYIRTKENLKKAHIRNYQKTKNI